MVWHVVMSGFLFLVLSHVLAEFCHTCWSWHTQLKDSRTHEVRSDWFFRGNPIWKLNWLVQIKHLISSELLKDKLDECDGQKNKSFSRQDKTTERQFSFYFLPNFSRGFLGRPKMTALIMLANVHWCASCNKTPLSQSPYPTGSPWPPHLSSPTHSSANGVAVVSSRKNNQYPYANQRLDSLGDCLTIKAIKMTILCGFLLSGTVGRLNCMVWF